MVRYIILLNISLRVRVREQIATLLVENECTNGLKAEVLGHELAHLLEQAGEAALRAHLRSQLERVDHGLLLLVHLLLRLELLDLHGEVGAEDLEDLLIGLVEAHVLVLPLDDPRLALDNEKHFIFTEDHWMCQMRLIL